MQYTLPEIHKNLPAIYLNFYKLIEITPNVFSIFVIYISNSQLCSLFGIIKNIQGIELIRVIVWAHSMWSLYYMYVLCTARSISCSLSLHLQKVILMLTSDLFSDISYLLHFSRHYCWSKLLHLIWCCFTICDQICNSYTTLELILCKK